VERAGDPSPQRNQVAHMSGFTKDELKLARDMRRFGKSWNAIAIALGRAHGSGIRRRLDPDHHKHRNAYMAKYIMLIRFQHTNAETY
jgi:hypothetical protein